MLARKTDSKSQSTASADAVPDAGSGPSIGPPVLLLGLAFASVLASLALALQDGTALHAIGYVFGALVPILLIGFIRRVDLDRRRSPRYEARSYLQPALVVLALLALIAAGLHIWPIATELSK